MTFVQRLDPRLHLAAAIGWAVVAVVTLAALVTANLAAAQAEQQARADAEGLLAEIATQVRDALSMNLELRRSLLQATAAQIGAAADRSPGAMGRVLDTVHAQYPEFARLVIVNGQGQRVVDTRHIPATGDVLAEPWFPAALLRPMVSDLNALPARPAAPAAGANGGVAQPPSPVPAMSAALSAATTRPATPAAPATTSSGMPAAQPAGMPAELVLPALPTPPRSSSGTRRRGVDMAVPVRLAESGGVLAAEVDWTWLERQIAKMQEALRTHRQLDLILLSRDGVVLYGPPRWQGERLDAGDDVAEGGAWVAVRRTQLRLADSLGFGWTAIVRQRTDQALASAHMTRRNVFIIVFVAGLLSAAGAMLVTRVLTRRLTRLAHDAEAVRRGERRNLALPEGRDEIGRIGATLSEVVDHLQSEKQSLQLLNAELDHRVAERTGRIERMADEARHAAVTRERLRLARDLHDTLAHSLMALLTQIRLVRKLHRRMDAGELEDELDRAEGVAATGLADARAAITQMRDNGVRDTGLGPALQDLARRFRQRSGVELVLSEPVRELAPLLSWADDRAEAVFRIVEEALRNVERHAQAGSVQLRLACTTLPGAPAGVAASLVGAQALQAGVTVIDDGVGFDTALQRPGHYGLRGMHEQAALISARLVVASQPGQGTRVSLDVAL
ncbi:MAG: hypothetical protein RLZZ584_1014 [Pseudomonadota bacterium]